MRAPLRIVLIGDNSAGIQALRAIAGLEHRIVAVMASPSPRTNANTVSILWNVATTDALILETGRGPNHPAVRTAGEELRGLAA